MRILKWTATAGVSLVFLGVGVLVNLYGLPVLLYATGAFLILLLVVSLVYLAVRVGEVDSRVDGLSEGATPDALSEGEAAEISEALQGLLAEVPSLREVRLGVSEERERLLTWQRRCLALLEEAYGDASRELLDFEGLGFHRLGYVTGQSGLAGLLEEAAAILRVAMEGLRRGRSESSNG